MAAAGTSSRNKKKKASEKNADKKDVGEQNTVQEKEKPKAAAADAKNVPEKKAAENDSGRVHTPTVSKNIETSSLKEKRKPSALAEGELIDGVNTYKVMVHLRGGKLGDVYKVKDNDQENLEYIMRTQPIEKGRMKFEANILTRANKLAGDKKFVEYIEFGTSIKFKIDYLVTSLVGPSLEEVRIRYLKANFSLESALNIAMQTLKGVQDLHKLGHLHRNIKPANFAVGVGESAATVYVQDLRIARLHVDPATKKPKPAREKVKFLGTTRYASRAALKQIDQGRKDDLESWLYMVYYLIDDNSIAWRKFDREKTLETKEKFFKHDLEVYAIVPKQMKRLVDYLEQLKYETEPDYSYLETFLKNTAKEYKADTSKCEWKDKVPTDVQKTPTLEASIDNKLSGELDDIVKKSHTPKKEKKAKVERKKMNPGDVIKSDASSWKVVCLLGSGGFGDVYKVHKDGGSAGKMYALKTESEGGEKRLMRLKVEVMVLMKCWADKNKKFGHFVEFVDRGKCEPLKCKFVVMGLVGPSIEDIRRKYLLAQMSKSTCFNVALQTGEALADLHSIGYLHRDIKPANFAAGLADAEAIVYMLDFGIAKTFLDGKGQHKLARKKVKFLGTPRYSSRACMKGVDQGRKDDLECWLYMVFDLMDESNGMPWRRTVGVKQILKAKEKFFANDLPKVYTRIPQTMSILVSYVDRLEYASEPDYAYIQEFLRSCAKDNSVRVDKKLDWVGKLKKKIVDSEESSSDDQVSGSDSD